MAVHPLKGVGGLQIRGRPWFCHRVRAVRVAHGDVRQPAFLLLFCSRSSDDSAHSWWREPRCQGPKPICRDAALSESPFVAKITARAAVSLGDQRTLYACLDRLVPIVAISLVLLLATLFT